jgi:myosin-5
MVSRSQIANGQFSIKHFAGDVVYDCEGFVEKNKDLLPAGFSDLLISSKNLFVRDLVTNRALVGSGNASLSSQDNDSITSSCSLAHRTTRQPSPLAHGSVR